MPVFLTAIIGRAVGNAAIQMMVVIVMLVVIFGELVVILMLVVVLEGVEMDLVGLVVDRVVRPEIHFMFKLLVLLI